MATLTTHQNNVRNYLALRMAQQIGIAAVLKRTEDPQFTSLFNGAAAALADTVPEDQVQQMILEVGTPVSKAVMWNLEDFAYYGKSSTTIFFDLVSGQYCTIQRRLYPYEVEAAKRDAEVLRGDTTPAIIDLVSQYDALDPDLAVKIFILGPGPGQAYRNASDLIFVKE